MNYFEIVPEEIKFIICASLAEPRKPNIRSICICRSQVSIFKYLTNSHNSSFFLCTSWACNNRLPSFFLTSYYNMGFFKGTINELNIFSFQQLFLCCVCGFWYKAVEIFLQHFSSRHHILHYICFCFCFCLSVQQSNEFTGEQGLDVLNDT